MKRFVSILLALLMTLSPAASFAATKSVNIIDGAMNDERITIENIDASADVSYFSNKYTDYSDGLEKIRKVPIYTAKDKAVVKLLDSMWSITVEKMEKHEDGLWYGSNEFVPIAGGTASYTTYEQPDDTYTHTDGYDDVALIATPVEHVVNVKDIPNDDPEIDKYTYDPGCYIEIASPGLYYVHGTVGPVVGYSEAFINLVSTTEAADDTKGDEPAPPSHNPGGYYPSVWARAEVNAARSTGIVPDYWYDNYNCLANTTRSQFCQLAAKLYCLSDSMPLGLWVPPSDSSPFTDTFDVEILLMHSLGVVDGIGDGLFGAERELTREQAAKILTLLLEAVKPGSFDTTKDYWTANNCDKYTDGNQAFEWAKNYIGFVVENGIMSGYGDGVFAPKAKYTLQQAMLTMYRLANKTDLWNATITEAASIYDLELYRSMYGRGICYEKVKGSTVSSVECSSVKVNGTAVNFTCPSLYAGTTALNIECETNVYKTTTYEVTLKVTLSNGTVYNIVDRFQHIDDSTGGI